MRKITTLFCSISFLIAGILIVQSENNKMEWNYKTMQASTLPQIVIPEAKPQILELGPTTVSDTIRDTVHTTIFDIKVVGKRKHNKTHVQSHKSKDIHPDTIPSQAKIDIDTLYVSKPVLIIPKKDTIDAK